MTPSFGARSTPGYAYINSQTSFSLQTPANALGKFQGCISSSIRILNDRTKKGLFLYFTQHHASWNKKGFSVVSLKNQTYSNLFKWIHNTIQFYFTDGEYCLSFGFYMQGTTVSIGLHYSGYGSVWHRSNPPGNFWSIVSISLRANQGTVLVRKNNPFYEK